MTWNNRILKNKNGTYSVHEVFYNDDKKPISHTENAAHLDSYSTVSELKSSVKLIYDDINKDAPILEYDSEEFKENSNSYNEIEEEEEEDNAFYFSFKLIDFDISLNNKFNLSFLSLFYFDISYHNTKKNKYFFFRRGFIELLKTKTDRFPKIVSFFWFKFKNR